MKLIKPSWEIIEQEQGLNGIYKAIERAGRTCYKSESNITEDSAKGFVERMVKSGHGAMLEHGTVYLKVPSEKRLFELVQMYHQNKYSKVVWNESSNEWLITTNYRVLVENNWLDDLQYICEPTEFHEKRYCVRLICDIGVTREFNRHRVNSIAEQSTRYCNFSKDKFNNELTFIIPSWSKLQEGDYIRTDSEIQCNGSEIDHHTHPESDLYFVEGLFSSEHMYMKLISLGQQAQQARNILPLATKTEVVYTTFASNWKHFFELRDSSVAHPQAFELANPLHEEFKNRKYI